MITMKKFIAIIALAGVALFSAGCESKSSGTDSTKTTTTVNDHAAEKAACLSQASDIGDEWTKLQSTLQEAVDSGLAIYVVAEAKAAVNRGIDASEAWLSECGSYYPTQASQIRSAIAELRTAANAL